jgi:aspartyl-tRNA(Asn)/glutamyl-tRNA(Gln) amidotransferase subunit A
MKLNEYSLVEAISGLKEKKFTSVELVTACFDQIDSVDSKVKAFLALAKDEALKQAKLADDTIAKLGSSAFDNQPLLGIPYACKDNFSTTGIETTASSNVLKGYMPPYESTVTKRLKNAGAILLGKTNMDAFAHGSSTETSDFFTTNNPWNLDRVAGGSSGGSTAAVAANMCIFSIGSETSGSIRGPAAWCGVTGLKPTYGRVSRYGAIAMASSTDSPGPIGKTVEDCALVLEVVAGVDQNDATSSPTETSKYSTEIKEYSLKGKKIGKPKSYFEIGLEPDVAKAMEAAIKKFEKLGAEIIDIDLLAPKYSIAVYTILQRSEVSSNLARFDGIRFGHDRTHFGFEAKKRMMLGAYALSSGYYDQYYAKAQKVRTLIIEDFNKAFEAVDFIIGPTMPNVAIKHGASAENPMFGEMADELINPSSIAGLSAISVPCGFSEGLPIGLQLIAPMFSEASVLGAASEYQKVTNFHKEKVNL